MNGWARALLIVLCAAASGRAAPVTAPHMSVELVSEGAALVPGTTAWIGVHYKPDHEWHVYWRTAGDSGEPPEIKWALPGGTKPGEIRWPRPERIELGPLVDYGYEGDLLLMVPLDVPKDASGTFKLAADTTWLVCQQQCVPGNAHLELELPVAKDAGKSPSAPLFERFRTMIPAPLPAGRTASAERTAKGFTLKIAPFPEPGNPHFFPYDGEVLEHPAPQPVTRSGDGIALALKSPDDMTKPVPMLAGVIEIGTTSYEVSAPVSGGAAAPASASPAVSPSPAAPASPAASPSPAANVGSGVGTVTSSASLSPCPSPSPGQSVSANASPCAPSRPLEPVPVRAPAADIKGGLLEALALAFFGGIVLNVMPCVFPVLSIKALEVVQQAGAHKHEIRRNALLYTLGVLLAFWSLAGLLIGLRAGGERLGWGFHLQSPGFAGALAGLLFLMALSLFGVFEFEPPSVDGVQDASSPSGALLTGVLATIVATPCTAPFMGTALGWAATQPALIALAVFTALGIGLASPYVAISFIPAVGSWLPRPGRWMETAKQGLAFPLLGTVIWLTWVVGLQTDVNSVALLLIAYLLFGVAGWIYGRWDKRIVRRSAALLGLLTFVGVGVGLRAPPPEEAPKGEAAATATGTWIGFSPQLLKQLLAEHRPVFVDFTAAWCLTCKVNELTALTPAVMKRMRELGVTALRADWTRRDETIAGTLRSYGRDGVPLYVLYSGKSEKDYTILDQVLRRDYVLEKLEALPRP